jgi:hypothetical protein
VTEGLNAVTSKEFVRSVTSRSHMEGKVYHYLFRLHTSVLTRLYYSCQLRVTRPLQQLFDIIKGFVNILSVASYLISAFKLSVLLISQHAPFLLLFQ